MASYKYQLTSPTTDLAPAETDSFSVTVSDGAATSAPATITIEIVDDVPNAVNDSDDVGTGSTATGNVMTDLSAGDAGDTDTGADTQGADGASVTHVKSDNGGDPLTAVGASVTINGQYGTLTLEADGDYTYNRTSSSAGTDVFTYTLTDGDGDTDTATLTIELDDNGTLVVGSSESDDGAAPDPEHTVAGPAPLANTGDVNGLDGDDILIGDPGAAATVQPGDTANVVFVLDTSGSMDADIDFNDGETSRLEALQAAVNLAIDGLAGSGAQNVRIHLVQFSNQAGPGITFDLIKNGVVQQGQVDCGEGSRQRLRRYVRRAGHQL